MPNFVVSRSLSTELILRMAMPLGAFALALMLLMGVLAEQRERQFIGNSLNGIAQRTATTLDYQLGERVQDVIQLAWLATTPDYFDSAAARRLFDNKLMRQPAFAWIGFADAQGLLLSASNNQLTGRSVTDWPDFREARHGLHVADLHAEPLLDLHAGSAAHGPDSGRFLGISQGILSEQMALEGVLISKVRWAWIRELVDDLRTGHDGQVGLEIYLIDRHGKVMLVSRDPEVQGSFTLPASSGLLEPGSPRVWQEHAEADGRRYLMTWSAQPPDTSLIGTLGWRVIVRQPAEIALGPVRTLRLQLGVAAGLLTLGILLLAWIQARRISRPLARIAATADAIAHGESRSIPTGSHLEEVDSLARALQQMIDSLLHSERERSQLHHLAHRDTLTGLHNRRALELQMETAAARVGRSGEQFVVFALDLDGFKQVNDTLGHAAGDDLLREVARRLLKAVRREEMLARLGGDEFVVLMMSTPDQLVSHANIVAARILACFEDGIRVDGQTLQVGCSIGAAAGLQGELPETLLPRADEALYEAKRNGRGRLAWWQASS
ncbi:diguanylate cyclase domain-containing protein [Uliginosibacterium paludis]|uniref:Diguanylate cyclase n=1 Tax=Uliginosibacterium paludis TaxID=1615952 RepID=A0ABV2CP10_9RHOO